MQPILGPVKGGKAMKTFVLYLGALVALFAAGVAYSAASPSAKLQKQDRVYGGGQFGPGCATDCIGTARNLAVDAHAQGDGSDAAGNSTYGGTGGSLEQRRSVTCVRVEGNHAVIGGIVESGSDAGYWYVQYLVDRGGPASTAGSRDLVSLSFQNPSTSPGCPSPTDPEVAYLELDEGDVVVQDAAGD